MRNPCEETGWRWDDTACGDPDHCSPTYPCECNPGMDDEHECTPDCHPVSSPTVVKLVGTVLVLGVVLGGSLAWSVALGIEKIATLIRGAVS
jgi:hypothetical protein